MFSFNLATTSASWRTAANRTGSWAAGRLQFGHDVSVVENDQGGVIPAVEHALQFGHDVSVVENAFFNSPVEPVFSLQFGHDVSVVENAG